MTFYIETGRADEPRPTSTGLTYKRLDQVASVAGEDIMHDETTAQAEYEQERREQPDCVPVNLATEQNTSLYSADQLIGYVDEVGLALHYLDIQSTIDAKGVERAVSSLKRRGASAARIAEAKKKVVGLNVKTLDGKALSWTQEKKAVASGMKKAKAIIKDYPRSQYDK